MKVSGIAVILAATLATAAVVSDANASLIPPHRDVVTQCHQVSAVYVSGPRSYRKYDLTNSTQAQLQAMAASTPSSAWVESGCSR